MSGFIYLASPYSHPDAAVREERYRAALDCYAWMVRGRLVVYSPIVSCHPVAVAYELDGSFDFWKELNYEFIGKSNGVAVLEIDGWKESRGIAGEVDRARTLQLPVGYVRKVDSGYWLTGVGR